MDRIWPLAVTSFSVLTASLMLPGHAYGAEIASDSFESYAVGSLSGNNGGTGWGGAWAVNAASTTPTVVAGGLSYSNGDVLVNGGSQSVLFDHADENSIGISDGLLSRALASSQTGTVYMSMLFSDIVNPDLSNDFVQWGFEDATVAGSPDASVMRRNGTLQVRSSTATSGSADSFVSSVPGTTNLLVFKATKTGGGNYDEVSLFLNPTSNIEPLAASATKTAGSGISSLDHFVARSAFHELNDSYRIDAIMVGTEFANVVPVSNPSPLIAYDGFEAGGATPGTNQYETGTSYGSPGDALVAGVGPYTMQGPTTKGFSASAPWQNGSFLANGGGFASSVYYQAVDTGLSYSDGTNQLITADGSVRHLHEATVDQKGITRDIIDSPTPGNLAYYSFLVRLESEDNNWNSSLEFGVRQGVGQTSVRHTSIRIDSNAQLSAFESNSSQSAAGSTLALDQDHFIVVRLEENSGSGGDTMHVWLNPDLDSEPTLGTADIVLTANFLYVGNNASFTFDQISLTGRLDNNGSSNPEDFFYFDEFRLGNTYDDVTPFVPEPSSLALIGFGGLLLARRRRHSSR